MRLFLHHTLTILRLFLYWPRGLVLALMLAPLVIHAYLFIEPDPFLFREWDDVGFFRNSLGWFIAEFYFLWALGMVLFAFSDKMALGEMSRMRTPHPVLPLTPRRRALGDALAIAIVCLAGALAMTALQAFIWRVPLGAAWSRLVIAWTLWLPLIAAAALHLNEGRPEMAILMGAVLGAAEMGAGRLGLLDSSTGTLAVSGCLLVAALLLGNRPRVRLIRWRVEAKPREIAEPRGSREGESLHRPACEPLVQLRRDTWRETGLLLKVCSQIAVASALVALTFLVLELRWGLAGWLFLGAVAVPILTFNIRAYRRGIPQDTVWPSRGNATIAGYLRAWAILPVPTQAVAGAMFLQLAVLVGVLCAILLSLAGVAVLRASPLTALAFVGAALVLPLVAPIVFGGILAFETGSLRERAITVLSLGYIPVVALLLVEAAVDGSWRSAFYFVLAIPGTVLGGFLPMARLLRYPTPEVTNEES